MNELVIEKRHNDVLDLAIAYGLLYILTENYYEATLHNYPGAYVIRHEVVDDIEDFELVAPNPDWIQFGKFVQKANMEQMFINLFGDDATDTPSVFFTDEVMANILEYYSTDVNKRNKSIIPKHASSARRIGAIGSWFGVKGVRGSSFTASNHSINLFERWLAELGFISGVSFIHVDKVNYLFWMAQPSQYGVSSVRKFSPMWVDKETGETRPVRMLSANSVEIAITSLKLDIQARLSTSNIIQSYDGVLFMRAFENGHTASTDKIQQVEWLPFSEETLERVGRYVGYTNQSNNNLQHLVATWLTVQDNNTFYPFVHGLAKEGKTITISEREDYLNMNQLKSLHTNIGIAKLGRRLSYLIYRNKGYNILNDLINTHTKTELMTTVSGIAIANNKLTGNSTLWDANEYSEFLSIVEDDRYSAKDISAAILLHSQTFIPKEEGDR